MNWFSRMLSVTAISFGNGRCEALKGNVKRSILSDLSGELTASGVTRGELWIQGNGRIRFSAEIPPELHQRLRNILVQI